MYIERVAQTTLSRYLSTFPAVGITGPRQSGKSTMLRHCLPDYDYVTFDLIRHIEHFESDPEDFLAQYEGRRVIFDEVQNVPKIFRYLKIRIDNHRDQYGQFVLTGSNQFAYLRNVSESLAGRIGLMSLLPLQYSEMPQALADESICFGAYPELVLRNYHQSDAWYDSYLQTYLDKDVRALSHIGDRRDFHRFIALLAARISMSLDMTELSKELGVSVPTVKRWLSVLEASYVIFLLPPFYENFGKRIVKSPKVYFYDTGLVSHLTGIKTCAHYDKGPLAGALFENFVIANTKKILLHKGEYTELYYIRTQDKSEVDLIVDYRDRRVLAEIKKSSTFSPRMATGLKKIQREEDQACVVYTGTNDRFGPKIQLSHYTQFFDKLMRA
ncbi:MAG: AAA family ATPase [Gammaproteobacteria bacterium CG11_big_fil_rev_8_21_14_0_20_46_22]|nr:MAG: AAA family ATPase [Gammaproteobacteria bacterium CG12_big_fil_rev_8_21_14_0_65_46_12]PIR10736.1 MAG: AAA family ATPase [Gammaproteobacteria bacterium CG11_big_fil_rev_8_21_14_0_20_46_22]